MTNTKLKPCPFCDKENPYKRLNGMVFCESCNFMAPAAVWDSRPRESKPQQIINDLIDKQTTPPVVLRHSDSEYEKEASEKITSLQAEIRIFEEGESEWQADYELARKQSRRLIAAIREYIKYPLMGTAGLKGALESVGEAVEIPRTEKQILANEEANEWIKKELEDQQEELREFESDDTTI